MRHMCHYLRANDLTPESLWALLSTVLRVTYNEGMDETTAYGLINIGHLKCVLDAAQSSSFILSLLSNVSASVVPWLSDDKRLLNDEQYNISITPAYLAILGALERASDDKAEILESYGELLAAISTRITPGAPTFTAFVDFWQRVFGDHFNAEQAPSSLRALLLISGCKLGSESPESQEQELVPETPVDTTEEEEWQEVSNVLEAISDSNDSVRSVPQSPVVLRSPVVDQAKSFDETQTTEASDTGSSSISSDEGEEELAVELPEPALVKQLLRLRKSLTLSQQRSQKRGREEGEEKLAPVKKRKLIESPTRDESSPRADTEVESGVEDSVGAAEGPADVESQPTLLESVPGSVVSPTVSPKVATKETLVEVEAPDLGRMEKQVVPVSGKRSLLPNLRMELMLPIASPMKRKREGEETSEPPTDKASSRPLHIRSPRHSHRVLEQPSPSKRRRLETLSDSLALRVLLPSSDELSSSGMWFLPSICNAGDLQVHTDDARPEEIPGSDDSSSTEGSFSPTAIDSPPVGSDEPGNGRWLSFYLLQRSNPPYADESPTKAHVERRQKRQQLAVRSHSVPILSAVPTVPVFNPRIELPRPSVLRRAFTSYDEVQEALVGAFDFLQDNASSLGMSKLVSIGNLLTQTSATVFGTMQKRVNEEI